MLIPFVARWITQQPPPPPRTYAPGEEYKWYKMRGAAHLVPPQEKLSYHVLPHHPTQAINVLREAAGLDPLREDSDDSPLDK
jgi:hypothetical protein